MRLQLLIELIDMSQEHRINVEMLEKRVVALTDAIINLGKTEDLERLSINLRRPGWTTPAEFAFALGMVESLHAQVNTLTLLRRDLLKASDLVRGASDPDGDPA
jgi:hypothetical protein